jgi:uncharacterized protein
MRWALPALALIAACAGASDQEKPARPPAKPALWLLADADTEIYLFGTIHVLPDNFRWRTPVFDRAARRSQELVVEVADLADEEKTTDIFLKLAMSPELPPVSERVPKDRRAGLEALRAKAGVPSRVLDRFETWAVAVTLAAGVLKTLDISPKNGVEKQLQADFGARRRPISGLETTEQQLGIFDALPENTQRAFLINMVDESADAKTEFDRMISAWSRGDENAIALTFDDEVALTPELTDALLKRRNAAWSTWLTNRLDRPGIVMVAVGAGHLAGPHSVQTILAKQGLKVTRLQ